MFQASFNLSQRLTWTNVKINTLIFIPPSTLPPVIRLWLEEYSEDFHEPPQYQALRLLCVHLRHRLCFRRLAQTAETLLKRLQAQGRE